MVANSKHNKKAKAVKPIPKTATKNLHAGEKKMITVDCSEPVKDRVFDAGAFKTFLQEKIKVDGRTGNLGDEISLVLNGNTIEIRSKSADTSSRYIKYLTKKHLKKQQLRDWLRVVSISQCNYVLKFFRVDSLEDAEEEDEE